MIKRKESIPKDSFDKFNEIVDKELRDFFGCTEINNRNLYLYYAMVNRLRRQILGVSE